MTFDGPSGWASTTVGKVLTLQRGFDITKTQQRPGPIPVVSSGGISSHHDQAAASGPGVVIGRKGALGTVFYLDGDFWPHDTTLWVKDFKGSEPQFVYYFLKTLDVHRLNVGSANPTLNRNHVHSLPVSWPPASEQRTIASVLAALDDKIDSNDRLAGLLEEAAATLFRARFVDFVGVEEFEESAIGRVPRRWRVGVLADLVEVTMGQSPPGVSYSRDPSDGLLLVQGMGGFGERYPTTQIYATAPTKRARPGATLMTVRAPVGAVNVARTELCLGRGVAGIDSDHLAFAEFLIRSLRGRWASEESGTIFPAVNRRQILGLRVAIPPLEEICEFDALAAPIVSLLAGLHDERESLARLRDSLLPKLISGQIRVPDTADPPEVIEPAAAALAASP